MFKKLFTLIGIISLLVGTYAYADSCYSGSCPIPPGRGYQVPDQGYRAPVPGYGVPDYNKDPRFSMFVKVRYDNGVGTGFIFYYDPVGDKAYVLTAAHVVEGRSGVSVVIIREEREYPGRVVVVQTKPMRRTTDFVPTQGSTWGAEFACIEVDGSVRKESDLGIAIREEPPVQGEAAYVTGWSYGRRFEGREGVITTVGNDYIIVNAPAVQGQSGSAIMDKDGYCIGIVSATDGRNTYATSIQYVKSYFNTGAWLPWRRVQEQNNELQEQINQLHAEIATLQERLRVAGGGGAQAPPAVPPGVPEVPTVPEPPIATPGPAPQPTPTPPPTVEPEKSLGVFEQIWNTIKSFGLVTVIILAILFIWDFLANVFTGNPLFLKGRTAKVVTKLIPGQWDDMLLKMLITGEEVAAEALKKVFGVDDARFNELKRTAEVVKTVNGNSSNTPKQKSTTRRRP